jgi:hypothetical protein
MKRALTACAFAWVLWHDFGGGPRPNGAFEHRHQCITAMQSAAVSNAELYKDERASLSVNTEWGTASVGIMPLNRPW